MGIWIRSQDKELLREIVELKYQKGTIDDDDIEVILGTTQYDEWEVLGKYATKERALQVLDEIQKIIDGEITMQKSVESQIDGYRKIIPLNVYEMAKE